jgi:hypothetical protein
MSDLRLETLADLTEPELLELLADELIGGGRGLGGPEGRIGLAREWLRSQLEQRRDALCGNEELGRVLTDQNRDLLVDGSAFIDALCTVGFQRPVVTVVAAILITRGYEALCGENA